MTKTKEKKRKEDKRKQKMRMPLRWTSWKTTLNEDTKS